MAFVKNIYCKSAPFEYNQENLLNFIKLNMNIDSDRKMSLFTHSLYSKSGIKKRYSCLNDNYFNTKNKLSTLTTADRQKIYENSSEQLIKTLTEKVEIKNKIDNLITVSCTGYMTTGLDFMLLKYLKTKESPFRYNIGAMGCYAGITALRLAKHLKGTTLLLCLELCSIHFQNEPVDYSTISGNSIFSDGAALIEINEEDGEFKLLSFSTIQIPNTEDKMSWLLRDKGFVLYLDQNISSFIKDNISIYVTQWLDKNNLKTENIQNWIIHPGSLSIVQAVGKALNLNKEKLEYSLKTLYNYGNMSSSTVFFTFEDLIKNNLVKNGNKVVMIAFGPGLVVEMALLEKISND